MKNSGVITKIRRELFYVTKDQIVYECKARGNFRTRDITPMVGDHVDFRIVEGLGYIEKVYPRSNQLLRPPVANVDLVMIVMSIKEPDINLMLLDRYLLLAEKEHLKPVIVFNKEDLIEDSEKEYYESIYRSCGYEVLFNSNKKSSNMLKEIINEKKVVITGPSGVGKSTTLNTLYGYEGFIAGEISQKTKRGKQTTRHIEMVEVDKDTFVLDTPGFSSLDLRFINDEYEIKDLFPEFRALEACKFHNCMHLNEPGCLVKEAVEAGKVYPSRYQNYVYFVEEFRKNRRY